MTAPSFTVGKPVTVAGTQVMHWEWGRFEVKLSRPWLWPQRVLCQLVAADGLPKSPLEVLGRELPGNWHHHPPLRFRVVADVTPLERGSFGHRGTLKWRLRVDRWVDVVEA